MTWTPKRLRILAIAVGILTVSILLGNNFGDQQLTVTVDWSAVHARGSRACTVTIHTGFRSIDEGDMYTGAGYAMSVPARWGLYGVDAACDTPVTVSPRWVLVLPGLDGAVTVEPRG